MYILVLVFVSKKDRFLSCHVPLTSLDKFVKLTTFVRFEHSFVLLDTFYNDNFSSPARKCGQLNAEGPSVRQRQAQGEGEVDEDQEEAGNSEQPGVAAVPHTEVSPV